MVIQNKAKPSIRRTTTKERWESMPAKYKKLFDIIDFSDDEPKEIKVSPTQVEKHTKKTPKDIVPPPNGEKKKRKKKGEDDTNDES